MKEVSTSLIMLDIYRETKGVMQKLENIEPNVWIHMVAPTEKELQEVANSTGLVLDFLKAALDEEERSRLETEEGQALILINIPVVRSNLVYTTLPLGIIIGQNYIVTVCIENIPLIRELIRRSKVHTGKKSRLLLQLLYYTAIIYIDSVKRLNLKTRELEDQLRKSMKNEEMFGLMEIQKSLVYLLTALKANQILMEKLLRSYFRPVYEKKDEQLPIKLYPEDEDLLEDALTENQQALSMAEVHNNILGETMDAFASIISNNLNIVMKFLTAITIILAIPALVGTFYGMNVLLPLQHSRYAFYFVVFISAIAVGVAALAFHKKNML